jgi:hypothetical protein
VPSALERVRAAKTASTAQGGGPPDMPAAPSGGPSVAPGAPPGVSVPIAGAQAQDAPSVAPPVSSPDRVKAAIAAREAPATVDPLQEYARGIAQREQAAIRSAQDLTAREAARRVVPPLLEAGGAAGGAALGSMVAGAPGAVVGGAGGARLGHAAGSYLFGEEPNPSEMNMAGIAGGAGPGAAGVVRHSARFFAKLPTVARAVRRSGEVARKTQRTLAADEVERVITKATHELDDEIAARAAEIVKFRTTSPGGTELEKALNAPLTAEYKKHVADLAQQALDRYREIVPRELVKALTTPESSVAAAATQVVKPSATSGTVPGALGMLFGGAYAGLEGAASAGAFGYLMGQMRGRAAYRLAQNEQFVAWATGLTPRDPLAQAALTFMTDVMLRSKTKQEADDAKGFYDKMLDLIEEAPELGLGVLNEAEGAEMPTQGRSLPHPGQGPLATGPIRIPRELPARR